MDGAMDKSLKVGESSSNGQPIKELFDQAMKLFETIENSNEPTNSDPVQLSIKSTISKFEKITNLVSLSGMFSTNERLEELPTETLQYLLLPALLGTLTLKIYGQPRKDVINIAEIYFKDFLQRCKDYGATDIEISQQNSESSSSSRSQTEQAKITSMVQTRDAKIKRYKEMKELKEKLSTLSKAMSLPTVDDETKREYFTTLLQNYINQAIDELSSIEQEKPILEYMAKHGADPKPKKERAAPLRPVIITRDAVQKAVFGLGYPSLPTMTVEEFYDKRVREGTFPGPCNIPHATLQSTDREPGDADADAGDDADQLRKERLEEEDDEEELARKRNMDEYKDEHRRGWGNRYNRS